MSGIAKGIGKVFKAVGKVVKKVAPIVLAVGAAYVTGGASAAAGGGILSNFLSEGVNAIVGQATKSKGGGGGGSKGFDGEALAGNVFGGIFDLAMGSYKEKQAEKARRRAREEKQAQFRIRPGFLNEGQAKSIRKGSVPPSGSSTQGQNGNIPTQAPSVPNQAANLQVNATVNGANIPATTGGPVPQVTPAITAQANGYSGTSAMINGMGVNGIGQSTPTSTALNAIVTQNRPGPVAGMAQLGGTGLSGTSSGTPPAVQPIQTPKRPQAIPTATSNGQTSVNGTVRVLENHIGRG